MVGITEAAAEMIVEAMVAIRDMVVVAGDINPVSSVLEIPVPGCSYFVISF
jgi:hypothetical protein